MTIEDTPNIRDLIARTLADHTGGEGTWDRLTAGVDPRMDLTSQERARRAQVYRDAADAVRDVMLTVPCGSCHPCENWVGEMWRRADRKPPYPEDWDAARARLGSVDEIARAAVALCADILRQFDYRESAEDDDVAALTMTMGTRDELGRQVLAWQDQLDNDDPDPDDLALPAVDVPPVRAGDRLILECDGRTWTRIYGEETGWTEVSIEATS